MILYLPMIFLYFGSLTEVFDMSLLDLGSLIEVTFAVSLVYYQFAREYDLKKIVENWRKKNVNEKKESSAYLHNEIFKKSFSKTYFESNIPRDVSAALTVISIIGLFLTTIAIKDVDRCFFLIAACALLVFCGVIIAFCIMDVLCSKKIEEILENFYNNKKKFSDDNNKLKDELESIN